MRFFEDYIGASAPASEITYHGKHRPFGKNVRGAENKNSCRSNLLKDNAGTGAIIPVVPPGLMRIDNLIENASSLRVRYFSKYADFFHEAPTPSHILRISVSDHPQKPIQTNLILPHFTIRSSL